MTKIAPYAKSIVGALVAGLGSLYQALDGDQAVTAQEWIAVAMTTLTALGVIFAVPNKDPRAEHQQESVQPPEHVGIEYGEHGRVDVVTVLLVVLIVVVILAVLGAL